MNKILVISTLPYEIGGKRSGGVASVSWNLIKEFKKNGFHIDILPKLFDYNRSKIDNTIKVRYSIYKLCTALFLLCANYSKYTLSLINVFHLFRSFVMLLSVDEFNKYDLIFLHHLNDQVVVAADILNIKVPVYVFIHSFSYAQSLDGNKRVKQVQNLNEQIDKVEGVIYVSKTSKYKGNELGIHSHENEVVIHNAIKTYNSINTQKE